METLPALILDIVSQKCRVQRQKIFYTSKFHNIFGKNKHKVEYQSEVQCIKTESDELQLHFFEECGWLVVIFHLC